MIFFGQHHYVKRKSGKVDRSREKWVRLMDKLIFVGAFVAPLSVIPQVMKIWIDKDAVGVSQITWAASALGCFVWLVYGILHKQKPIIIANFLTMIFALAIFIGAIIYS